MNLGESSRQFRRPSLSSQKEDEVSGFAYQKRIKLNHNVFEKNINNENDKYDLKITNSQLNTPSPQKEDSVSVISSNTIESKSTRPSDHDLPPREIPTSNYIQHIPDKLSEASRLRQLLIWFATKELERDQIARRKSNKIVEKVKRKLIEELKTSRYIVSWHRQMDVGSIDMKKNPQNLENEQLLIKYQNDIKAMKQELEEWKKCADDIYEHHALTMDKVTALERKGFKVEDNQQFIENLEPNQQSFITEFLDTEPEHEIGDVVSTMDADVNKFRVVLETAKQFELKSNKLANKQLSKLVRILNENTRLVPIELEEKELDLFQNEQEKQDKFKNTENVFKLLSRQP